MLKRLDREDLDRLWGVWSEVFKHTDPTEDKVKGFGLEIIEDYMNQILETSYGHFKDTCMIPWNGGFYGHCGVPPITDKDGVSFKVNGQRLKKYYGGNIDKEDVDGISVREWCEVKAEGCLYGVSDLWICVLTLLEELSFYFSDKLSTAYSLNEYSVFDTCINIAYPGEPSERNDNVGGVFINLEILKCWSLEISRWLVNTLFAQELKLENHPEQHIRGVSQRVGHATTIECGWVATTTVDSVMLDSDESGVTYTELSSPFEGLSDIRSPRADNHEYLKLPGMPEDPYVEAALQAPPSPDYVPGPEEPEQAPPSPDYVPGPEHADDEIVAEEQPYAKDASPTTQPPDYVSESDPEADPEEDDDEDPEEDPVDYPADGGDDGDDEDGSSEDDEDDDMDIEADDDEDEEEHVAPANSVVVALPTTGCQTSAISTPPSSPLSPWSSPLPQIPPPSLPLSPPSPVLSPAPPPNLIHSLGYQAAMIWLRAEAVSTSHSLPLPPPLPISVPTSSPSLLLPSASRREDRPEVTLPPRKRLGIALGPRYEIRRDPEREVGYGITDSWDEIVETLQGAPVSTDTELGRHMTTFETRVRQDIDEIYMRLDDEQSQRQLLDGQLNMLFRDKRAHAVTLEMLKADHRRSAEMRELRTVDRTRQQQLIQTLTVMQSLQGQKMAPKRATRLTPVTTTPAPTATTTTSVTNAQLQTMIDQGVTAALAARDANRNGDDSHTLRMGGRRTERVARECTYQDFMKSKPLYFKGTEGVNSHVITISHDVAYALTWAYGGKNVGMTKVQTNVSRNISLLCVRDVSGGGSDKIKVELGSFNAIIGMDWLAKYQAVIVCDEKIVRIPWGNETLIVHDNESNQGHKARLHIISVECLIEDRPKEAIKTDKLEPCADENSMLKWLELATHVMAICGNCDHAELHNQFTYTSGSDTDVPRYDEALLWPNMKASSATPYVLRLVRPVLKSRPNIKGHQDCTNLDIVTGTSKTDGQRERGHSTLEDYVECFAVVHDFRKAWDNQFTVS
ncbi:hypothetical protein Tco_0595878 [Tanacetum coccineum]